MLHQSDEVVRAQVRERRECLQAEAAVDRLARRLQPPTAAMMDRMLGALGALLVQWGDRLQTRSRSVQDVTQEIFPA